MKWQDKLTEEFGSFWIDLFEFTYRQISIRETSYENSL